MELKIATINCCSTKYITQDVYDKLKGPKSKLGGTSADSTRSGCVNSHCGIYTCDPEGYDTFADLLHPVIHKAPEIKHHKPDFGDLSNLGFGDLDPKTSTSCLHVSELEGVMLLLPFQQSVQKRTKLKWKNNSSQH
ncbi:Hypothetical predicted protein [Mytilus galloprovincialis]|uniref:Phosphagen kinase N-terminal domain-containing protein n=1 Tax=Mytilus galloprovincialis TaxID=29158 RepID=A0A8B6G633_MYTGA|nr:Hypothetical predicted protein [Mytilus galloprovincialis]